MTQETENSKKMAKGGNFLITKTDETDISTPEDLSFEQKELGNVANKFSLQEVYSKSEKIEQKEEGVVTSLLKAAGALGLLMAEVPEAYGGLELNKACSTIIAENITHQGSFSVAFMCHTGIGLFPLLYYGNEDQKKKYLSKLASGEMIGAYALTEANAGTDAMSLHTNAKLSDDKKYYILNGEKVFCTNGGIADLITIFAKIDGDKLTAFLVERGFEGVSFGKEEDKMGILGSSTVSISLSDAKIPVENVLGEIGKGHKIAFNILNIGRWKLGAASIGAMKRSIEFMSSYANERYQFNKPISSFELIQLKIANSTILTYLAESQVYRLAGDWDQLMEVEQDKKAALEEFAIEASITKVFCSEALQYVADESVQLHGGYGYIREYPAEHQYRDCRINRIFEGTNEINRLIITQTLLKRALTEKIKLMDRLQEILVQLKTGFPSTDPSNKFAPYIDQVEQLKRLAIYVAGVAVQKYTTELEKHQSTLATVANIAIEAYALESGLIRAIKASNNNHPQQNLYQTIIKTAIAERIPLISLEARQTLINIASENSAETESYLKAFARIISSTITETSSLKNKIAKHILEREKYEF
ncbi:MAG: acyl-CoA dehydrogenase [Deltaproteobacteria bacterium CG07_land_8_20_14_0_80_38_7]|nr:MAG: acyl-CoA dehydrogenase [Deltaproteobacteria bacterium CG07_land_8_20_14_0_80_38_7]